MKVRAVFRWLLAAFFLAAGLNHFREPGVYAAMMPPWMPRPYILNALAGAFEMMGAIGVLIPTLRSAAGWGLIALLVAVFPVNVRAALIGEMPGITASPLVLWLRLPLQAVFIAWVAWVSLAKEPRASRAD